jgi:hypothetical protein
LSLPYNVADKQFQITDDDTALTTVYVTEQYDLSSYNVTTTDGTTGWIMQGVFQELDIATGESTLSVGDG